VRSGWSPPLYRRFARGEFDAAVLLLSLDWAPEAPCRRDLIRREPLVIVAPRAPQAPPKARVRPDALGDRAWILNPDGCGFRHALARALGDAGHHLRVQFEMDAAPQEHLAMVAAGMGCSLVPASALAQTMKLLEHVQQLSVREFDYELGVWIVWSERWRPIEGTPEALAAIFAATAEPGLIVRASRPAAKAAGATAGRRP